MGGVVISSFDDPALKPDPRRPMHVRVWWKPANPPDTQ
jgi:hypothetical protein